MTLETPPITLDGSHSSGGLVGGNGGTVLPPEPTSPAMDFSTAPHQIDYASINQSALAVLPALLRRWLPDGRIEGAEYVARNPTRDDLRAGSFKVNLLSGKWS